MENKEKKISNDKKKIPFLSLLLISSSLFVSILTEALPAGFLLNIQKAFTVSESDVGMWISVYAMGSIISAIPLTLKTQHWSRKRLLLTSLLGFSLTNCITSFTHNFEIALAARFFAGIFAGLLWSLAAGYTIRMVAPNQQGKALSFVMLGVPLALSLGIPAGTYVGNLFDWRVVFNLISLLSLLLIFIGLLSLPDIPGVRRDQKYSVWQTISIPGMKPILIVNFTFALGHYILYTYVSPFLSLSHNENNISALLLVFGVMSVLSIFVVGMFIDNHLRRLILASIGLFVVTGLILSYMYSNTYFVFLSLVLWGLAFGGGATLFQTASAKTSGDAADVAQSIMVTVWNFAIAGGGLFGGIILDHSEPTKLPLALVLLMVISLVTAMTSTTYGVKSGLRV